MQLCEYFKLPLRNIQKPKGENIMTDNKKTERNVAIVIHVCIWTYIFAFPLLYGRREDSVDWLSYFQRLYFPISSCLVFYANYFYFVPRLLLDERKRVLRFVLLNIVLISLLLFSRELYVQLLPPPKAADGGKVHLCPPFWAWMLFHFRSFLSLAFLAFMAVAVRLSVQWQMAERARSEAELGRREAELKNLKNQINPHFLLNTLNNIYALTAFSPQQAQGAIEELSRLLRYVLYENEAETVTLEKEIEFLESYVELMRLRLPSSVSVETNFDAVKTDGQAFVAPLIFISLVENAFKHGISPASRSFIRIRVDYNSSKRQLVFVCQNSNHPKTSKDKSPGGIGLKQVLQRLEHSYPGRYEWLYGTENDGVTYSSQIKIYF